MLHRLFDNPINFAIWQYIKPILRWLFLAACFFIGASMAFRACAEAPELSFYHEQEAPWEVMRLVDIYYYSMGAEGEVRKVEV